MDALKLDFYIESDARKHGEPTAFMHAAYRVGDDQFGKWIRRDALTPQQRQYIIDQLRAESAEDLAVADQMERSCIEIKKCGVTPGMNNRVLSMTDEAGDDLVRKIRSRLRSEE